MGRIEASKGVGGPMDTNGRCDERASCLSSERVSEVQARLSRLEGHLRAIGRMLAEGRDCQSLLVQMAAVKSALNQVTVKLLEGYVEGCLVSGRMEEGRSLDQLKGALGLALKFS